VSFAVKYNSHNSGVTLNPASCVHRVTIATEQVRVAEVFGSTLGRDTG
jgi:hypothetical protein